MPSLPNTDHLIPGNFYHVFNHAVGSENLFRSEENYGYFLDKFKTLMMPVCKVYAYCLMPNHFHFLIQVKAKNELNDFQKFLKPEMEESNYDYHKIAMNQFKKLFNGYAQAFNKMYDRKGSLFMDYVRRKEVEDKAYFAKLIHYIHFNPVHHGFCKSIADWPHSSYHSLVASKPTKLERITVVEWFGSLAEFQSYHTKKQPPMLGLE